MSDFWSKALGVTAPPPQQAAEPASVPVRKPGAWWQSSPVASHVQAQVPPKAYQQPGSVVPGQADYQTLKAMRADEMSQEQMEALALLELSEDKYNQACPQCGSADFLPAGTRVGSAKMPIDKCFHCGSSGALTNTPETAVGGTTGKAGRATRQTVHGGQGTTGRHHSQLHSQYIPRQ